LYDTARWLHAAGALQLLLAAAGHRDLGAERLRQLHGHGGHAAADAGDQHVIARFTSRG